MHKTTSLNIAQIQRVRAMLMLVLEGKLEGLFHECEQTQEKKAQNGAALLTAVRLMNQTASLILRSIQQEQRLVKLEVGAPLPATMCVPDTEQDEESVQEVERKDASTAESAHDPIIAAAVTNMRNHGMSQEEWSLHEYLAYKQQEYQNVLFMLPHTEKQHVGDCRRGVAHYPLPLWLNRISHAVLKSTTAMEECYMKGVLSKEAREKFYTQLWEKLVHVKQATAEHMMQEWRQTVLY